MDSLDLQYLATFRLTSDTRRSRCAELVIREANVRGLPPVHVRQLL
jgi:hypothetical protein